MSHPGNLIIEHYERHALEWDADRRAAAWNDKYWIDRFANLLPANAAVLDLGCGGGKPVAFTMAARGFRITGVDSSTTLISLCQNRMPDQLLCRYAWAVTWQTFRRRAGLGQLFSSEAR